jgi:FkbM family methyltransferase
MIKKLIKKTFSLLGLSISKAEIKSWNFLLDHKIDLLIDVGANNGQYAKKVREYYFGKIVSIEPIIECHNYLKIISKNDDNWFIYDRIALGDESKEVEINIAGNSVSSSILPMLNEHKINRPISKYVSSHTVNQLRLDDIFENLVKNSQRVFIKIDSQGYEGKILNGLGEYINDVRICGFEVEMSIVDLYDGQLLHNFLLEFYKMHGFRLVDIQPGFRSTQGYLLQYDATFIRNFYT